MRRFLYKKINTILTSINTAELSLLGLNISFKKRLQQWNPQLYNYVYFYSRHIYSIDLNKTIMLVKLALNFLKKVVQSNGIVLIYNPLTVNLQISVPIKNVVVKKNEQVNALLNFKRLKKVKLRRLRNLRYKCVRFKRSKLPYWKVYKSAFFVRVNAVNRLKSLYKQYKRQRHSGIRRNLAFQIQLVKRELRLQRLFLWTSAKVKTLLFKIKHRLAYPKHANKLMFLPDVMVMLRTLSYVELIKRAAKLGIPMILLVDCVKMEHGLERIVSLHLATYPIITNMASSVAIFIYYQLFVLTIVNKVNQLKNNFFLKRILFFKKLLHTYFLQNLNLKARTKKGKRQYYLLKYSKVLPKVKNVRHVVKRYYLKYILNKKFFARLLKKTKVITKNVENYIF
jgi:ribosomal protein S2